MKLWTRTELEKALNTEISEDFEYASGVSIDSRTVESGDIFIALKGENHDGAKFAEHAIQRGAVLCILPKNSASKALEKKCIYVENTTSALNQLAVYSRHRLKGKVIAVTGSVGKTITKEMLKLAFTGQGNVYATVGNLNNHFGLPLSLANVGSDTDYAILEMGMNHVGEIFFLSKMARPDIAIITAIEAVHLEFFSSISSIADAKSEIFDGMNENATAIINFDTPYKQILIDKAALNGAKIIGFGKSSEAHFRLIDYKSIDGMLHIKARFNDHFIDYKIPGRSEHIAIISLIALAAIQTLGEEIEFSMRNLEQFTLPSGRGSEIYLSQRNLTIIDDAYNASPVSMKAALKNLAERKSDNNRLIAILGDMKEIGKKSVEMHKGIADDIDISNIDVIHVIGEDIVAFYDTLPKEKRGLKTGNWQEMLELLNAQLNPGDIVLVKSSNSMGLYNLVAHIENI